MKKHLAKFFFAISLLVLAAVVTSDSVAYTEASDETKADKPDPPHWQTFHSLRINASASNVDVLVNLNDVKWVTQNMRGEGATLYFSDPGDDSQSITVTAQFSTISDSILKIGKDGERKK
jgi:hypothetical protein